MWDYPRPPALVACDARVRIEFAGVVIARTGRALRVLETRLSARLVAGGRETATKSPF